MATFLLQSIANHFVSDHFFSLKKLKFHLKSNDIYIEGHMAYKVRPPITSQIKLGAKRITSNSMVRKTAKALVAGAAICIAPKVLHIDPAEFDTGIIPSLFIGIALGFGKITRKVIMGTILSLIAFGPVALAAVFPLSALGTAVWGRRQNAPIKNINHIA